LLELENGQILEVDPNKPDGYSKTDFAKQTLAIPGASSEMQRTQESARGDREMTVSMMSQQNRNTEAKLRNVEAQADSLIKAALNGVLANPSGQNPGNSPPRFRSIDRVLALNKDIQARLMFLEKSASGYKQDINSMSVEIHKKFSIPAACLSFVLIGAPLGSLARKGGFATGIALSLFFFIVYWAFLISGEQLADSGSLPAFWAMWLPNIIISAIGIILTIMFIRQSSVVSMIDRIRAIFKPDILKRVTPSE
jgi:lipopolysaccharide export system permease protein